MSSRVCGRRGLQLAARAICIRHLGFKRVPEIRLAIAVLFFLYVLLMCEYTAGSGHRTVPGSSTLNATEVGEPKLGGEACSPASADKYHRWVHVQVGGPPLYL